jgi:hypothetical protein
MTTISWVRTVRVMAGLALCAAGLAAFFARPGVALAHHVTVTEWGDCSGWLVRAEYIGGGDDRMVVVDVTINGEVVQQTFYFDDAPGHIGHQNYWLLFERTGSGPVQAFGTVVMYAPDGGAYTDVVDTDDVGLSLECEAATQTPTSSPTTTPTTAATPTPTPEAPSTPSPVPTATATQAPTDTPEPTETPFREDVTPLPSPTITATATASSPTPPARTATATPGAQATPTPAGDTTTALATPTLVDSVLGITPTPRGSDTAGGPPPRTGNAFPSTGTGTDARSTAWAFAGLLFAGVGLALASTGLRLRCEQR